MKKLLHVCEADSGGIMEYAIRQAAAIDMEGGITSRYFGRLGMCGSSVTWENEEVTGADPPSRWRDYGVTMVTGGERSE